MDPGSSEDDSLPWLDLPPELLGTVFRRLPTRGDRARFQAVCRQWRSTAVQILRPLLPPMVWLVLPCGSVHTIAHGETYLLPEGTRCLNSWGECLLLSHGSGGDDDDDYSCFLMNPFTGDTIPLPSLASYSYYDEPVETVNDRVPLGDDMPGPGIWMDEMCDLFISVTRLIVCSTRLVAAIVAVHEVSTIALCQPGDAAWSVSANERCRLLSDMVLFQGKLYAIDANNEDLFAINIVDEQRNGIPRVS